MPSSGAICCRDAGRVVDQERVGEDGRRVLGDRELDPVAVGDRAAPRVDRDLLDLLRRARGRRGRATRPCRASVARAAARTRRARKSAKRKPMRRSTSRTGSVPRLPGRGGRRRRGRRRRSGLRLDRLVVVVVVDGAVSVATGVSWWSGVGRRRHGRRRVHRAPARARSSASARAPGLQRAAPRGSAPRLAPGSTRPRSAAARWIRSLEPSRRASSRRREFSRLSAGDLLGRARDAGVHLEQRDVRRTRSRRAARPAARSRRGR